MREFTADGTLKKPKDMQGKICLQPFTNVDVHSHGGVRCCSESWMRTEIGNIKRNSLDEIWNGETIQKIRASILDGSYSFCDWHQCPFYSNEKHYLFTADELKNPEKLDPVRRDRVMKHKNWLGAIFNGETTVKIHPANYNFAYDESCNLACPSCRTRTIGFVRGPEYEQRKQIQDEVLKYIESAGFDNVGRINISGSGEPFSSKLFKEFLFRFDGQSRKNLDINIQSNGVLFDQKAWEKMDKIHGNINEVLISIDACTAETYDKVRVNGDFEKLMVNLEFMKSLYEAGKIRRFMLAFVVQYQNYSEMRGAIEIGKRLGVERIVFNLLNDWETWSKEQYERNAIWKSFHPEFPQFIEALKDPVFSDPIVDLGNMQQYWTIANSADNNESGSTVPEESPTEAVSLE
jgi:MoaA/NifB/PqqE/SkfB family radical SAM enzyme